MYFLRRAKQTSNVEFLKYFLGTKHVTKVSIFKNRHQIIFFEGYLWVFKKDLHSFLGIFFDEHSWGFRIFVGGLLKICLGSNQATKADISSQTKGFTIVDFVEFFERIFAGRDEHSFFKNIFRRAFVGF